MTTPDMEAIQSLFDGYTRTDANGWAKHCRALFDRCRELEAERENLAKEALKHLQFATPRERNGPCHQAINILRKSLGLKFMEARGKAMEGIE